MFVAEFISGEECSEAMLFEAAMLRGVFPALMRENGKGKGRRR